MGAPELTPGYPRAARVRSGGTRTGDETERTSLQCGTWIAEELIFILDRRKKKNRAKLLLPPIVYFFFSPSLYNLLEIKEIVTRGGAVPEVNNCPTPGFCNGDWCFRGNEV